MANTLPAGNSLRDRRRARQTLRENEDERRQRRAAAMRQAASELAESRHHFLRWIGVAAGLIVGLGLLVYYQANRLQVTSGPDTPAARPLVIALDVKGDPTLSLTAKMATIPAGVFTRGALDGPPDTRPAQQLSLPAFQLDIFEVSNQRFAEFVTATGYITTAEQLGKSYVFLPAGQQWQLMAGASWRHPHGPDSTIVGKERHPVVQVSWYDAVAYAQWAQLRLPTEAEWERAARGGRLGWHYPWGNNEFPDNKYRANSWQGAFPFRDLATDGHAGLAEIGSFEPTQYGLYDISGNVAEWCADWYAHDYYAGSPTSSPTGPTTGTERVVRGGSWVSSPATGRHTTVFARDHLPPGTANNHTGFRCARSISNN